MSLPVDNAKPLLDIEHDVLVSPSASTSHDTVPTSVTPTARRSASASWRDPRLIVGLVIVAISVLAGVKLFSSADDTVAVWTVTTDLRSGTIVEEDDLARRTGRLAAPSRPPPQSSRCAG